MEELLRETLVEFKKSEYKIHVLHTSMQGMMFLQYHHFLDEIYKRLGDQIDEQMEMLEQLGFNVPVNFSEIIKKEIEEDTENDDVIELYTNTPSIEEQLSIVENTLMSLKNMLQEGILKSGELQDLVVQNNLIEYQKKIRFFEWQNRRIMGQK